MTLQSGSFPKLCLSFTELSQLKKDLSFSKSEITFLKGLTDTSVFFFVFFFFYFFSPLILESILVSIKMAGVGDMF